MEAGFKAGEQAGEQACSTIDSKADSEAGRQVGSVIGFMAESASRQAGFVIDIDAIFTAVGFRAGFVVDLVASAAFTACNWLLPHRSRCSSSSEDHAMC